MLTRFDEVTFPYYWHHYLIVYDVYTVHTPCKIQLISDAIPVRHAHIKVPQPLQLKIKEELNRMVAEGI